jgi:hypothetical protein
MSNIFKVTDEEADDGEGVDTWRSERFGHLIDKAREDLGKLAQLPYPPSAEIVERFGRKEPPLIMSSLSYPPLKKE